MSAIEERIVDRHVLKLLRAMPRAGVMEDRAVRTSGAGTPRLIDENLERIAAREVDGRRVGVGGGRSTA
jgi:hypothetical protein